jgi:2-keto-4-pentenoate hydratase/2-oxohepta-3-ene-1,7-dioic acid hydratase in catechol pathway
MMLPGKSFDTHGPIEAWVVTADEVDPAGLGNGIRPLLGA